MEKNLLSASPWLDNFNYEWTNIEKHGHHMKLKKNEVLYHFGDTVKHVYLVKSGRIRMFLTSIDGHEKAISIIGKNALLGESCIYNDHKHITSAIAVTDSTVIAIPPSVFKKEIIEYKKYTTQVFELMSLKIHLLSLHTLYLAFGSSYKRICDSIIQLGITYGEKKENNKLLIPLSFTHQELADLVGTTRVTVANHLNNLIDKQLLSRKNQYYCIEDLEQLMNQLLE